MTRRVRTTRNLLVLVAAFTAGCAQTSGTYVLGDNASPVDWPTPKVDRTSPPAPPEPTMLPQAVMPATPAESQTVTESARPSATARRNAPGPTMPPAAARRLNAATSATTAYGATPAPRDVWERVRNGLQMRPLDSSLVGDWENYYAGRPDYFGQMIQNSSHFLYHIITEVERRGMPLEIALLPMI